MIENFSEKLKKYAELIVKVGVNVQKGQPVVLYISVTQQELAHLIVEEAYEAGASEVMIEWKDTFSEREFLKHASEEKGLKTSRNTSLRKATTSQKKRQRAFPSCRPIPVHTQESIKSASQKTRLLWAKH